MTRKRIIGWSAGVIFAALLAFTILSASVYKDSLPRVRTLVVEKEMGELLEGYDGLWETFAWVPKECVFPGQQEGIVLVYRVRTRKGQFNGTEYYVEAAEIPMLEEREDAVLLENLYLNYSEILVCQTDFPLKDGQTVIWLDPEQESAIYEREPGFFTHGN